MADLHMTDFYRDSAKILLQLYNRFPNKVILYAEDICGPDSPDEFGLPSPRFQSCFSTMIWLAEAGLITYSVPIRQEALDQTTLSREGLVVLFSKVSGIMAVAESDVATDRNTATDDIPATATAFSHIEGLRLALKSQSSQWVEDAVKAILAHPAW